MVRRNLGSATPPSVMALFLLNHTICSIRGKRRGGELEGYQMCRWRGYWWPIHHSYFPLYHRVGVQARHYIPNGQIQAPGQSGGGPFYNPNLTSSQECFEALFQKNRINLSKNFGTNARILPWRMLPEETNNLRKHKFVQLLRRRH